MPLPKSASVGARATEVYSETCPIVLNLISKPRTPEEENPLLNDVLSYLPFLRQLLTCCACAGIAEDSMISTTCGHCYCYECQFREPVLKIQCRQCRERKGLVGEEQLRLVVRLYKELVTLLSIHFKDATTVREPLREMIREIVNDEKVSRALLMLPPPPQYQSTPKQITITPAKRPKTAETNARESSVRMAKKSRKKLLRVEEGCVSTPCNDKRKEKQSLDSSTIPDPQSEDRTSESPVIETSSRIVSISPGSSSAKKPSGAPRKRSFLVKVGSSNKHKTLYPCRCGTNAGVTLGDRICARKKCACYVNKVSCKYCKCRGCCNPFNGNSLKRE